MQAERQDRANQDSCNQASADSNPGRPRFECQADSQRGDRQREPQVLSSREIWEVQAHAWHRWRQKTFQEKEEHGSRNGDTHYPLVMEIIMSHEPLLTSLLNTSGRQLYVYCYFTSLLFLLSVCLYLLLLSLATKKRSLYPTPIRISSQGGRKAERTVFLTNDS